jgi:hypothetical protein
MMAAGGWEARGSGDGVVRGDEEEGMLLVIGMKLVKEKSKVRLVVVRKICWAMVR